MIQQITKVSWENGETLNQTVSHAEISGSNIQHQKSNTVLFKDSFLSHSKHLGHLLGQGTVPLPPIPHDSVLKIPLPGVPPQRQLLVSPTPRQSEQKVKTWPSFPSSYPASKASNRIIPKPQRNLVDASCWPRSVQSSSLSPTPGGCKGYHFPMLHISYLNCPVKLHS